jgi:hypothetical protein
VLALLADGAPRARNAIIAALADRHPKDEVRRTLMCPAITEWLVEHGRKDTLPAADGGNGGPASVLRTLQRRIRHWRTLPWPGKDIVLPQAHRWSAPAFARPRSRDPRRPDG